MPSGIYERKHISHCKRGHERTSENVVAANRRCRLCYNEQRRKPSGPLSEQQQWERKLKDAGLHEDAARPHWLVYVADLEGVRCQ